ncbi:hypothetical protein L218DRAFT_990951 [Marasmius fiardii PR-910]|nr:hypothetical protein L218DRAFT_990951 [Marasmius fiardii PR-910]
MRLLLSVTAYILLSCITGYATVIPPQHVYTTGASTTQHMILQRLKLEINSGAQLYRDLREAMVAFQEANRGSIEESYLRVSPGRGIQTGSTIATQFFLTNNPNMDFSTPFILSISGQTIKFESKATLLMTNKTGLLEALWPLDNGHTNIGPKRGAPNRTVGVKDFATTIMTVATRPPNEDPQRFDIDLKLLAEKASAFDGNVGFSWGFETNEVETTVVIVNGWRSHEDYKAWCTDMDDETRAVEKKWKKNAKTAHFGRSYPLPKNSVKIPILE